jgi:SWI/SNF-related matrix-associated actin-dependent regulator 1 of chromatin subfamily A
MELTFNDQLRRYEFRCQRTEKDRLGRLGLALGTQAGLKPVLATVHPLFITGDPYRALQLQEHATPELRDFIKAQVAAGGGGVPVLTLVSGVYIWTGPIEANGILYNKIPKDAGFAFTRRPQRDLPRNAGSGMTEACWWTEQTTKAQKCIQYADDLAREQIERVTAKHERILRESRAQDADIDIPVPDGLVPFGYQKAGVAYAIKRSRVLFGDEMGLGKTVEAILWINMVPEIKRVLVICPASLKRNWMRELERWLVRPTQIGIADTRYSQTVPNTDIVIANYELLSRRVDTGTTVTVKAKDKHGETIYRPKKVYEYHLRESFKRCWDLVIVDECHKAKGDPATTVRSRMVYSIAAERVAFLSGTPMVNRPRELWHMVHYLAPKVFSDQRAFENRYCKGGSFMDPYAGGTNLKELQDKLRLWIMIRRLKRDVLKDLPPKLRQVIELPADGRTEGLVKSERLAFEKKEDVLTSMRLRVELAKASDSPEDYKQAVATLTAGIQVAFEDLSRIRKETAIAKIPVVIEHVKSLLDEGHKVILFTHHKDVAYAIAHRMESDLTGRAMHVDYVHCIDNNKRVPKFTKGTAVVAYTGDHTLPERDDSVQLFQTDDKCRLFIGTIGAAGVGLTLTASSYVVFAELDWVPGNVTQAEDRAHRIGQKDNVLIQHLVLEASLDQRMATTLVEKQDMADRALDREDGDEILADPITPDREKMATMGVTPKEIAKIADAMSPADIAAVHMGVRMLAGKHKDSHLLDGTTFRDVDAPLGNVLAQHRKLTPKLAALGKKLLNRYRHTQLAYMPEIQQLFGGKDEAKT